VRDYTTIRALRNGEIIDLDGLALQFRPGDLESGDLYVAERNTGPELLTCSRVAPEGYVLATTNAYPYDTGECVRVEEVMKE